MCIFLSEEIIYLVCRNILKQIFGIHSKCAVIRMNLCELKTVNNAPEMKCRPHSTLSPPTSSMTGFKKSATAL